MMSFANTQIVHALVLYFAAVVIPHLLFCYFPLEIFSAWKVKSSVRKKDAKNDLFSTLTSFLCLYLVLILSGQLLEMRILSFRSDLPTWYLVLSFPMIVLIHDAYFYWTHALMHKSKFLFKFHRHHHLHTDVTPLDAMAFHPVEAFVHFIFFLIYPLVIPTTLPVIQFMFIWMIVCNSAGHLPYEFYPKFLYDYPVVRNFNASIHHQMHHKFYNSNFGIYYTFWDKLMGTLHKDYFESFRKVKNEQELTLKKKLHPSL
jgi:Delta7-sterol 5-desaturase